MKKIISLLFALLLIFSLFSTVCFAQESVEGNCFLEIDGVLGESIDPAHVHWFDVYDYTLNTVTDKNGNEIITGITFTSRIDRAAVELYNLYKKEEVFNDLTLETTRVSGGKREVVSTTYLEEVKITDFNLILLPDNTVAETVTLITQESLNMSSPFGSTFGTGNIILICIGTAVIVGVGAFFIVRKKKRNKTK